MHKVIHQYENEYSSTPTSRTVEIYIIIDRVDDDLGYFWWESRAHDQQGALQVRGTIPYQTTYYNKPQQGADNSLSS